MDIIDEIKRKVKNGDIILIEFNDNNFSDIIMLIHTYNISHYYLDMI
jgi:hypothetical protein